MRALFEAIAYIWFYYIKDKGGAKKYVKYLHSLREYSYIIVFIFNSLSCQSLIFLGVVQLLFYFFYKLALILYIALDKIIFNFET